MTIHVEVISRERKVFEEEQADMVLVPSAEGQMGVLPRHAPTIAPLDYGELIIRKGNAQELIAVFGGVVDVRPGHVVVLAELAKSTEDIDEQRAEEARERAERILSEGLPPEDRRDAVLELRRANLELQVARKMKDSSAVLRIIEDNGNGNGEEN